MLASCTLGHSLMAVQQLNNQRCKALHGSTRCITLRLVTCLKQRPADTTCLWGCLRHVGFVNHIPDNLVLTGSQITKTKPASCYKVQAEARRLAAELDAAKRGHQAEMAHVLAQLQVFGG